jgi:hypothetical protein
MTEEEMKELEKRRKRELKDYIDRIGEPNSEEEFESGEWDKDDMVNVLFNNEDEGVYFTTSFPADTPIDVMRVFFFCCCFCYYNCSECGSNY